MQTDRGLGIALLLRMRTRIFGQDLWTDADQKFEDSHITVE